jgi:diphosphomevalonate decarboxylase
MSNSPEKQNNLFASAWQSPSNIALIKYWGKHGRQLPRNASVSFTLSEACTRTEVSLTEKKAAGDMEFSFYFEGKQNPGFEARTGKFLQELSTLFFPWLHDYAIQIDTTNTFPHSSGIASSASGMSALSLCLCDLDQQIRASSPDQEAFAKRASLISRLGSGSACRSVFPRLAAWGVHEKITGSSDMYAVGLESELHEEFHDFHDDILIINEKEKSVSSTAGHQLMENNPYATARYQQANDRMTIMLQALKQGDLESFVLIAEEEALTLHALMMCSAPSYMLMEAGTLSVIRHIREFRKETGIPVCFTLDAGPNVHVLYPHKHAEAVSALIQGQLLSYCKNGKIITDRVGDGPARLQPE